MGLFNLEKEEEKASKPQPSYKQKLRKLKVANVIKGKYLVLEYNGNGERLDYSEKLHGNLKVGDTIEVP